ncbi:MAG: YIP1 family protein [Paenibacillaceae bacterium]|nr:YIP1 family protein [Paenibacillaceae bacterium]
METELQARPRSEDWRPWLLVWFRPRYTIRQFLDSAQPLRHSVAICMIAGTFNILQRALEKGIGGKTGIGELLPISVLTACTVGFLFYYLASVVLKVTGKWLGGQGTSADLRVALTRGVNAPAILLGLLWLLQLLALGKEVGAGDSMFDLYSFHDRLEFLFAVINLVLGIWFLIIAWKAIGEAHRFSAVKAFLSMLIPGVILVMLIAVATVVYSMVS